MEAWESEFWILVGIHLSGYLEAAARFKAVFTALNLKVVAVISSRNETERFYKIFIDYGDQSTLNL